MKPSLSILMVTFSGESGLAGFIGAKDNVSGGDNWSYKMCKAPVTLLASKVVSTSILRSQEMKTSKLLLSMTQHANSMLQAV